MGWVVNATPRPFYLWERPGTKCVGGWVGPDPGWTGAENLTPNRIRSPDRVAIPTEIYRPKLNMAEGGITKLQSVSKDQQCRQRNTGTYEGT